MNYELQIHHLPFTIHNSPFTIHHSPLVSDFFNLFPEKLFPFAVGNIKEQRLDGLRMLLCIPEEHIHFQLYLIVCIFAFQCPFNNISRGHNFTLLPASLIIVPDAVILQAGEYNISLPNVEQ